jgi:hypothetical protein
MHFLAFGRYRNSGLRNDSDEAILFIRNRHSAYLVLLHQLQAVLKVMISCSYAWRYCE